MEPAASDGLQPHKLNKSFSVKVSSGRKTKKYTLAVGSMGLSLLDGSKPYKSFIYANLASWEAGPAGFSLVVGVEKKKVDFVTTEGEEIVALITIHASEIAEKYLADQRREEEAAREEEAQRQRAEHERMRLQHRQLEERDELQLRERQQRQQRDDERGEQLGSPEHEFRSPPSKPATPGSADGAARLPQQRRRSSLDSEVDRRADGGWTTDEPAGASSDVTKTAIERAFSQEDLEAHASELRIRQEKAHELAERAMEQMQHANRPDDYRPAQELCESALQLDPESQLARGALEHVTHALKAAGIGEEHDERKGKFAGLGKKAAAAAGQLGKVAPKGMMQGMKSRASKTSERTADWMKQKADEQLQATVGQKTGAQSGGVGIIKIHADCGFRMMGSKGVSLCAFIGSQSAHTSFAREKAEHGAPQFRESLPPIAVEEVTETLQIVLYRGDLSKHMADFDRPKLRLDRVIGQVLIPLAHLYPLRRGTSVHSGAMANIMVRPIPAVPEEKEGTSTSLSPATATADAMADAESGEAGDFRQAFHEGAAERAERAADERKPGGVLRRGRRGKAKAQHDTPDDAGLDALAGGDSGLAAGGIALTEMEKWKHTWPEHEYQREKQQTKEKRTQRAATNKNDDLFRNMTLGGGQRPGRADEDDAMETQSVKSAPGGLGGGGASARRIRQSYGSRSVSGLGSDGGDENDSQEGSGTSMPVSVPSSNLMAGGGGGGGRRSTDLPGRAVHFASVDDGGSEASFASSEDTSGTGGSSGFEPRRSPESPSDEADGEGKPRDANISPATSLLPDAPTTMPEPILKGPGSWYEIFPFCAQNKDGKYRTAVDELDGLAMTRPEPRKDLPAEPRTLGYVRLKVELELLSNPYSCYLRAPKIKFADMDNDELSIARLKANWLRLKMVLMPSHFVHRARDIARWQSIPASGAVWSFWAYLSLMAPFWQYPVFFLLLFGAASASGRHNDRLLEEVIVWEDIADDDPDPFSFRHIGKIKKILMTVQRVIGKVASFGERIHYIFSFTDPIVTYVAMFVTVVFVLLASMALYALYNVAVYIGGRAIFFTLGSIAILPPRFSVFPWSLIDEWEDFLMVEGETEAALFARKKNRRKRLGEGADLHLERRIQSEVIPKAESTAATDPTAAADPKAVPPAVGGATESGEAEVGEPNADGEVTAATAATGDGAAGSVEGEGTGDAEEKPEDIKAALDAFEKQDAIGRDDPNPEPATNVVGMLGNLWSRIPDAPLVAHRKICALQAEQAREAMEASLRFAEAPTVAPTEPNGETRTASSPEPSPAPMAAMEEEEDDDEEEEEKEMRMEEDPFAGEWAGLAGDGGADQFSVRGRASSRM